LEPKHFPDNIFFFGAGASVAAGVQTTFGLVDEFNKSLSEKPILSNLLNEILSILQSDNHQIDIEELLETIERLEKRDNDNILKFYDVKNFKLSNSAMLLSLKKELRNFITKATTVKKENIQYLEPLFSYIRPVRIFSVNYDTSIEQLCNVYKKNYTDGFDHSWNPSLFEHENLDVYLYKLHGSIIWYKTDKGEYLKLPIPPRTDDIELIFGEKAHQLMIYPMQKWEFDEPLLDMMFRFKTHLEEAESVIVAGYSFRDPYILRIFHDAAVKNRRLVVILIDPRAREIYETKLRYYNFEGTNNIPSPLNERVLCLQYPLERILPILQDQYIYAITRNGLVLEERCKQESYSGRKPSWFKNGPLEYYFKAEFIDKGDLLLEKVDWQKEIDEDPVRVMYESLKMFTIAEEHNRPSMSNWLEIFRNSSFLISPKRLVIRFNSNQKGFEFSFLKNEHTSYPFNAFSSYLVNLLDFFYRKQDKLDKQTLSFDLSKKIRMLYNFVISRKDAVRFNEIPTISNELNNNYENYLQRYNNALAGYLSNKNNVTQQELFDSCSELEKLRLQSIIEGDDFNDYFLKKWEKERNIYDKYIPKI